MTGTVATIAEGFSFTEAPRWRAGRLWFSDFYTNRVISMLADGSDRTVEAETEGQPGGIDWLPDGRLLIVSTLDRKLMLREHDGSLVVHGDLSSETPFDLNDLVVDAAGNAYVGTYGFDVFAGDPFAPGTLCCVTPDGSVTTVADDLWFPNGSVVTPDNVLIVNESFSNRMTAFDVRPAGDLANRRTWAQFGDLPRGTDLPGILGQVTVACDGAALDSEGAVWVADFVHGRAVRVLAGGQIAAQVAVGTGVFACALGGPDRRTLFLCVSPDFHRDARIAERESRILAVRVDVPGAH